MSREGLTGTDDEPKAIDLREALTSRFEKALRLPATGAQVAQFIAHRAAGSVGASYSNIALLSGSAGRIRLYHGSFLEPSLVDRYTVVRIDAPYPIAAAVRTAQPVFLPDLDAYRDRFPDILADTIEAGLAATASIPLFRGNGATLGAIGFAWRVPTHFDTKLCQALRSVADLCAATIERAEAYDSEHELIVELQRRLLPDLPDLDGLETAAQYIPAGHRAAIGGDWYEGLRLDATRLAVVVGDVTGHGMAAAADMALIRGMITALLHAGVSIANVFSEVSSVVLERPDLMLATAALAIVDLNSGTLSYATAGHPPPLLCHPDGQVELLDSAHGPLIPYAETTHHSGTAPFVPGSQLVMYTDGLVERRNQPFDVGVQLMVSHIRSLPQQLRPKDLIDSILTALRADRSEDDIAVLVVERSEVY